MKVMLRNNDLGSLVVYVAKKDLEEDVVQERSGGSGPIYTLSNGWELELSNWPDLQKLPQTVDARRLN
jgi:nitrogen fixation protein NifT